MLSSLEILSFTIAFISVLVSVGSVYFALRSRNKATKMNVNEELKPAKKIGLILLVGPSKGSAPAAINYHIPDLKVCWLIGTTESLNTIQSLIQAYPQVSFIWGEKYLVNPDEIASTFQIVSNILTKEILAHGMNLNEIIGDITGGLKPMSAGVSLACSNSRCNMQYMKAPRDENGYIIRGAEPDPVKINLEFY